MKVFHKLRYAFSGGNKLASINMAQQLILSIIFGIIVGTLFLDMKVVDSHSGAHTHASFAFVCFLVVSMLQFERVNVIHCHVRRAMHESAVDLIPVWMSVLGASIMELPVLLLRVVIFSGIALGLALSVLSFEDYASACVLLMCVAITIAWTTRALSLLLPSQNSCQGIISKENDKSNGKIFSNEEKYNNSCCHG